MVGNDVVDLRDPESNPATLHPRFDTRVFTAAERASIERADDGARQRWRLWAAKEATYKLARKRFPTTVFSPACFEVEVEQATVSAAAPGVEEAVVEHAGERYRVCFTENESALHAVALREGESGSTLLWDWKRLEPREAASADPEEPSRAVRELLCERVAAHLGVDVTALEVRRRGRIPQLWLRGEQAPIDLSLSHHGDWLAFACHFEEAHLS